MMVNLSNAICYSKSFSDTNRTQKMKKVNSSIIDELLHHTKCVLTRFTIERIMPYTLNKGGAYAKQETTF
jgi:hypothetical protein